jgi:hypothetical protein
VDLHVDLHAELGVAKVGQGSAQVLAGTVVPSGIGSTCITRPTSSVTVHECGPRCGRRPESAVVLAPAAWLMPYTPPLPLQTSDARRQDLPALARFWIDFGSNFSR